MAANKAGDGKTDNEADDEANEDITADQAGDGKAELAAELAEADAELAAELLKTQALQPAAKWKPGGSRGKEHATPWAEGVASGVYDAVDDSSEEDRWPTLS